MRSPKRAQSTRSNLDYFKINMKIFLVGYMACGKSTIGRKLNQRLSWKLYDTDKEIITKTSKSISEIFDTNGEEHFRGIERETITDLISRDEDMIISTGGGAPTYSDNMELMQRAGLTIYLSRSAENIVKRLSKFGREKRPKLRGLDDNELLEYMQQGIAERLPYYSKAQLIIDAEAYTDDQIVQLVINHMKKAEG